MEVQLWNQVYGAGCLSKTGVGFLGVFVVCLGFFFPRMLYLWSLLLLKESISQISLGEELIHLTYAIPSSDYVVAVCSRSDGGRRSPCAGAGWTRPHGSGASGHRDTAVGGQLWSSAAARSAECCSSTGAHLLCLELATPLLSTSALACVEARARSSFFLPPKRFPVVLTAGKFQGDGDNSAGCETNPPKPKAATVKTIDEKDR